MRPIKKNTGLPAKQGLYDPQLEHDACGVGFVVNIRGEKSHEIVRSGLEILVNLTHRGACGCDPLTGDGAGILTQIPHDFFQAKAAEIGVALPSIGDYGIGTIFLPRDEEERRYCLERFEKITAEEGQRFLGWRDVPIDNSVLGSSARDVEPMICQMFVGRGESTPDDMLEWKLYVIRKRHANEIADSELTQKQYCYVPSLSSRVIIYKGLLLAEQVEQFYPTWPTNVSCPPWPWCTSATARTRFPPGISRIRSDTWPTTAKSTPCAATSIGCMPEKACSPVRNTAMI